MKDVKIAGEEGREFWFKLGEPVKEAAHGLAERAFGAVEGGDLLVQQLAQALRFRWGEYGGSNTGTRRVWASPWASSRFW
jgi:hypothetical protein